MVQVRCPGCGNTMTYMPQKPGMKGKVKRCVYCGKSFTVHSGPDDSRIVGD